ncbi:MAG TPA: efflux RND transporter periplasmic adaptor subunit, partial [Gemmatimonadales bacterium]|nr:efflux RND transporter periplasmic adaptor subunit [Gemmatimonadales bacterium]
MSGRWMIVGAVSLLLAACGGGGDEGGGGEGAAGEMTAEEHARMQAGGGQGATDTSGQVLRQPVHLTEAQERALGVVYTTVRRETLTKEIRTVGQIMPAESRLADVTTKIEGFVEALFVNTTGAAVRRGQPLLAIYSPMLVAAQEEFLTAKRLAARVDSSAPEAWRGAQATLDAARRRLAYWDISAEQIATLEQSGQVTKTLTLASPVRGIVLEKDVIEGQRVMPGEKLYRI